MQVRLKEASNLYGPRDVQKWGGIALWVLNAINQVDESMKLDHRSMRSFEARLEGTNRLINIEAAIAEGNMEGRKQREELGVDIKTFLDRGGMLQQQVIIDVFSKSTSVHLHFLSQGVFVGVSRSKVFYITPTNLR